MDQLLHSDLWMHILSFVNVLDASRNVQFTSRRFFYLVSHFQHAPALGENSHPCQLAAASTPSECLHKLSRKPSLVLSFQSDNNVRGRRRRGNNGNDDDDDVPISRNNLPPDCVVLGARATDVQSNIVSSLGAANNGNGNSTNNMTVTTANSTVMVSFGPDTIITPFCNELPAPVDENYDVIIVYACGHHGYVATEAVSRAFPSVTVIVGGICQGGFVSSSSSTGPASPTGIQRIDHGFFGIAARNMPLRTVVSRGVTSLSEQNPWTIRQARVVQPNDDEYMFDGQNVPYHCITELSRDDMVVYPASIMQEYQPDFCGIQQPGADGFELHDTHTAAMGTDIIIASSSLDQSPSSLENAQLDLFDLSGDECKMHLDWTLDQLKRQTHDETILGALMFSCNGRGPSRSRSLLQEDMGDATRFAKHFPNIPCCGFYANGEIGPLALANCRGSVFQRGKSELQGFTVVFALFIVPTVQRTMMYELDDSEENVANFVRSRLGRANEDEEEINNDNDDVDMYEVNV